MANKLVKEQVLCLFNFQSRVKDSKVRLIEHHNKFSGGFTPGASHTQQMRTTFDKTMEVCQIPEKFAIFSRLH